MRTWEIRDEDEEEEKERKEEYGRIKKAKKEKKYRVERDRDPDIPGPLAQPSARPILFCGARLTLRRRPWIHLVFFMFSFDRLLLTFGRVDDLLTRMSRRQKERDASASPDDSPTHLAYGSCLSSTNTSTPPRPPPYSPCYRLSSFALAVSGCTSCLFL